MKILYAGDSPAGGPANYLLGILRALKADFLHLGPSEILAPHILSRRFDTIILSDFSAQNVPRASQKIIRERHLSGTGLIMMGGWGSFSGPFGGWRGSAIEKILPVSCLARDDRTNFPGGALMTLKTKHNMFNKIDFKNPPVICGLNEIRPKKEALTLLSARKVQIKKGGCNPQIALDQKEHPLLVIGRNQHQRVAALTTDLAPHWCGGLVDWGGKRLKLRVNSQIQIEVGDFYVKFVSGLICWLAGKN